jgi:hypothetical protein
MNAYAVQQKQVACTPSLTSKVFASLNDTRSIKKGTMNMERCNICAVAVARDVKQQ